MKPYRSNDEVLVNVEQIIPLPEAEKFQVSARMKRAQQNIEKVTNRDSTRRDIVINGQRHEAMTKEELCTWL
jgi:hypothetical protein